MAMQKLMTFRENKAVANTNKRSLTLEMVAMQGPLTQMSEAELQHWMRSASLRVALLASKPLSNLLEAFGNRRANMSHSFEVQSFH